MPFKKGNIPWNKGMFQDVEIQKEKIKRWYKNNPERIKKIQKRYWKKKRQFVDDYKLSKGCSICGYNKCAAALDFHHNGDKKLNVSNIDRVGLERINKEMEKCIVICCRCHRELHAKLRSVSL